MHRDSCAGSEMSLLAGLVRDVTEEEKHFELYHEEGEESESREEEEGTL